MKKLCKDCLPDKVTIFDIMNMSLDRPTRKGEKCDKCGTLNWSEGPRR